MAWSGPAPARVELILRRALLLATVFTAVAGGGALAAGDPPPPELESKFEASFTPTALSNKEQTPLSLRVGMGFRFADGSHLPPLKEFEIEEDRHARLNLGDVPVCNPAIQTDETPLQITCRPALIGHGKVNVEIAFPDQEPIPTQAPLRAYNGPVVGGARTLFLIAYLTVPTPAAIVTDVSIAKVADGPNGLKLHGTIPKVAGGNGSITHLGLRFRKGVFSGVCRNRHLATRFGAGFLGGTKLTGAVTRPCTAVPEPHVR